MDKHVLEAAKTGAAPPRSCHPSNRFTKGGVLVKERAPMSLATQSILTLALGLSESSRSPFVDYVVPDGLMTGRHGSASTFRGVVGRAGGQGMEERPVSS
jgi:hypothetical protein